MADEKKVTPKRMCKMVVVEHIKTGVQHRMPANMWFKGRLASRNNKDLKFIKDLAVEYPSKLTKKK